MKSHKDYPYPLEDERLVIVDNPRETQLLGRGEYTTVADINGQQVSIYSYSPEPPSGFCKVRKLAGWSTLYFLVEQL